MVVKIRKWSRSSTRKFQVAVKLLQIEGGFPQYDDDDDDSNHRFVAIKVKWKGEPKLFPFQSSKKEISTNKILSKEPSQIIEWDQDHDPCFQFQNTCSFSLVSNHPHPPKFGPWEIAFSVLYGKKMDSKAKMAVIGRASINISEIASTMDNPCVQKKLPLSLQVDGFSRDATLTVLFNFVEIRSDQGLMPVPRCSSTACIQVKGSSDGEHKRNAKARQRSLSLEEQSLDELGQLEAKDAASSSFLSKSIRLPAVSGEVQESGKKVGWFSWGRRHFSFKRAKNKEENLDEKVECCSKEEEIDVDPHRTSMELFCDPAPQTDDPTERCSGSDHQQDTAGVWEEKELVSRDGEVKLKASVFLASFDQCSNEAAGESACTALVAVISHWLLSNRDGMPSQSELDNLIMQGSSEWRKLCEDASYVNEFPNKHFDLETVLRAGIGPISISHNKSFVGFFGAETFESLTGVMSFDDIWNGIAAAEDKCAPGIYIVSWNDHFFVLKVEENAYYIIDTLGERLYEGCNQAFILRFDDKSVIQKPSESGNGQEEGEEIICSGKECCGEFIKRFLAAVVLKELEEEDKKKSVSYFSLHQRLQIEFNYACRRFCYSESTASSSLSSSPVSCTTTDSVATQTSSPFYDIYYTRTPAPMPSVVNLP